MLKCGNFCTFMKNYGLFIIWYYILGLDIF